jgi:DNA-binding XRE family transcriptional regulator
MTFKEMTGKPFHVLLKEFRTSRNQSQEALCREYGIQVRTYKRWESGGCSPAITTNEAFTVDVIKFILSQART